jgi:hypothetical protein
MSLLPPATLHSDSEHIPLSILGIHAARLHWKYEMYLKGTIAQDFSRPFWFEICSRDVSELILQLQFCGGEYKKQVD